MAEATDLQMQNYCDQRIRPAAEAVQSLLTRLKLDKAQIDDLYARASGVDAWADARTDGPPHLLQSGNGANPDDLLNYNAFATELITFIETTKAAEWAVLQRSIVRSL